MGVGAQEGVADETRRTTHRGRESAGPLENWTWLLSMALSPTPPSLQTIVLILIGFEPAVTLCLASVVRIDASLRPRF